VVGFLRTLEAPLNVFREEKKYEFVNWSDGGGRIHQIDTPPQDTIYTANYKLLGAATGHLRFRIQEYDTNSKWTGKFLNGITVKVTDTTGQNVVRTHTSAVRNGADGWVSFDNLEVGTYGILAYKSGLKGVWKQVDCNTKGGSFENVTISNSLTEGQIASFDNHAPVNINQVTVCQDLGLRPL
jgi:hypothetical protein